MSDRFSGDWYAPIVRTLVAPLWALKERSPYLKHLRYLKTSSYRSLEEVRQDQWDRLKRLLSHAYVNTPYYAELFDAAGIAPDDIRTWDDFGRIPLLTKDAIRANRDRMVARNMSREMLVGKKTSGSTGVSLSLYVDEDSMQWKRACALRHDMWSGWKFGEKIGAVWGNPEYKKSWRGCVRNFLLERATYLDTLKMDDTAMSRFFEEISRKRPTLLFGHAHSLYLFASFLKKNGLAGIHPQGIISTAMILHDHERKTIEEVFGCKVTNRYGCEEVSLIACECEAHNGLHLNMDTLIVECIRDGRPAGPGEPGAIVITDLTNVGMPIIRYKVGDVGILSGRACACGRSYPLFESIEGRTADYVVTPEGSYISGISLTENFAMALKGVKQLQIVQEELDLIRLRIVKGEDYTESVPQEAAALVRERFGPSMRHDVELVESIQSEGSGKYRFCISMIQRPFM